MSNDRTHKLNTSLDVFGAGPVSRNSLCDAVNGAEGVTEASTTTASSMCEMLKQHSGAFFCGQMMVHLEKCV